MKLLITCVPMILRIEEYKKELSSYDVTIPVFTQNMKEEKLIEIIPEFDAWIVGDDPVTQRVLQAAIKLKVLVKWGIGIDNIDLENIKIPFHNTPGMFGNEVADIAIGYLISLTRKLYLINEKVKNGEWYKPAGISLQDKKIGLIGFGDIGRNIADRLISLKTKIHVYDPGFSQENGEIKCKYTNLFIDSRLNQVKIEKDMENVFENSKIVILACAANKENKHIINEKTLSMMDEKSYIINVSRGSLVDEKSIIQFLNSGKIEGFASDVFENEPYVCEKILKMDKVIVGSHNASNTIEAVDKTSFKTIELISKYF